MLGGQFDIATKTFRLSMYQLAADEKYQTTATCKTYSWEIMAPSASKFSAAFLDLKNSVTVVKENREVILVSILNQSVMKMPSCSIVIYLHSPIKLAGRHWRWIKLKWPQEQKLISFKYCIQSCVFVSNRIYCSCILEKRGAFVHAINLDEVSLIPLHEDAEKINEDAKKINLKNQNILSENYWLVDDSLLTNCFLSVQNEMVNIITFKNLPTNQTIMEVMEYPNYFVKYQYSFSSIIKVISASLAQSIPNVIVIIYHDETANSCCVQKVKITISSI